MSLPGISKGSMEKAIKRIDRTDVTSLLSFVEALEASLAAEKEKNRVIACSSMKLREVFDLFGFSNTYTDIGGERDYHVPEMRLNLSTPSAQLKPAALELLHSIATVWPFANKSNLRLFVSMLIHFAIEQINSEFEEQPNSESEVQSNFEFEEQPSEGPESLQSLSVAEFPAPGSTPVTTPTKMQHPAYRPSPVMLKAYTEAAVTWETTDEANKKVIVKGFIDYGVSHAQKTPESLETFLTIVETKGKGEINDKAWAQLLAYMGIIQKTRKKENKSNTTVYGLLTDGLFYEFSKISDSSKVSRSRRFSAATNLGYIYKYLSHCLRAIIRSSPTSSSSKPQNIGEEVAKYEEIVQPKYIFDFEVIDINKEDMIDMA